METLIIYAHPQTAGFNSAILSAVKTKLNDRGIAYELIDLYAIGYDPVLKKEEHYTAGNKFISEQNLDFQKKIGACRRLIIIYPVWWNSPPAILKGFFDRILTSGFAYRFNGRIPQGLLRDKKAAVFLTHGGPALFTTWILRDRGAKVVVKDTLGFCGIKAKFFKLSDARRLDGNKIKKINTLVGRGLSYLFG